MYGIPSNFSFLKQSFIDHHTIILEVCFNNREFHSSILGVILGVILCFLGVISLTLSIILCILGVTLSVILNFLSTFLRLLSTFLSSLLSFCPPFLSTFRYNVHHLNYLAHRFHCLGVHFRVYLGGHSKFWGSYYSTAILFDEEWKM